ncbi:MAG: hypothetical protein RLZZ524_140, partial [Pseudomonadota bacterium]
VTLMGLLALPAMLRAGYSIPLAAGSITAGGCLGILIPPSVLLIVYGATAGVSVVQLYAGAFFPGLMLASLYVVYVILVAWIKPAWAPLLSAGAITAGGCLGILIPPSVMLIVYGATAGVSVVQLYAGAFFPGIMLAGLYILYVIIIAKLKPHMAPPLSAEQRFVPLPALTQRVSDGISNTALPALVKALKGERNVDVPAGYLLRQLFITLLPALVFAIVALWGHEVSTRPAAAAIEIQQNDGGVGAPPGSAEETATSGGGLAEPPSDEGGLKEPPSEGGVQEPPGAEGGVQEPPGSEEAASTAGSGDTAAAARGVSEPPGAEAAAAVPAAPAEPVPASTGYWIGLGVGALALVAFYAMLSFQRLEVFKMLLASFFPLVLLILSVLGSIVFGLATPTEAAAVGAFGGLLLAAAYKQLNFTVVKESVFLTAKTSAMVCWLFVGSAIFSVAFALLGGQELVERWVLSMNLSKTEFLLLSQVIIFILGWPLEWTEIIVIFMPIFVPLLDNFGVDPLFFGLLVALNLQTAFLSPPVAMAAFYLKGVSPPHVTLNQIFAGMLPFMGIQVVAIFLLYMFPEIGLWLPQVLYGR